MTTLGRVNLPQTVHGTSTNDLTRQIVHRHKSRHPVYPIAMEGLFFNVNNGYIEGLVRGYRNGLLTSQNYANLTQCETLDGKLLSSIH